MSVKPEKKTQITPRQPTQGLIPEFHMVGFDGPLDLLLELAERQRIDLGTISVASLAAQFVAEADRLACTTSLMKRADWLIWVARLVFLRSRLLFTSSGELESAESEAHRTVAHLDELLRMRAAATWLEQCSQLGVTTFSRGNGPRVKLPLGRQASFFGLMEACLSVLERELEHLEEHDSIYSINAPVYWTITDALMRVRKKISEGTFQTIWQDCVPSFHSNLAEDRLGRRAAIAGVFVAGLELIKQGELTIEEVAFPEE